MRAIQMNAESSPEARAAAAAEFRKLPRGGSSASTATLAPATETEDGVAAPATARTGGAAAFASLPRGGNGGFWNKDGETEAPAPVDATPVAVSEEAADSSVSSADVAVLEAAMARSGGAA